MGEKRYAYHYQIYGLRLATNRPISILRSVEPTVNVDVTVDLRGNAEFINHIDPLAWQRCFPPANVKHNGVEVLKSAASVRLRYHWTAKEVLEFVIDHAGTHVALIRPATIPESDADSFLLGPVIGSVLRLRQRICLHASVLAYDSHAFALIGPKGAGKSTTAAELVRQGAELVADDIAVLERKNNVYWVESGYPQLRLMPNAIQVLGRSSETWQPVLSMGRKRYVPLDDKPGWHFFGKPCPFVAGYILSHWRAHGDRAKIDTLTPSAALRKIGPHGYPKYFLDKQAKRREFDFFGQMVKELPSRIVSRPIDINALPQLGQLIINDFQSILNKR